MSVHTSGLNRKILSTHALKDVCLDVESVVIIDLLVIKGLALSVLESAMLFYLVMVVC